jgi:thymidine kinase
MKIYKMGGKNIVSVTNSIDERYGKDICTHDGTNIKPNFRVKKLLPLLNDDMIMKSDVVFIEEGQFFDDIVDFCTIIVDKFGKSVVVSSLDGDYERKPFKSIANLIPIADTITKLKAICLECSKDNIMSDALFSKRITNDIGQQLVGGSESYKAVCRKHFNSN